MPLIRRGPTATRRPVAGDAGPAGYVDALAVLDGIVARMTASAREDEALDTVRDLVEGHAGLLGSLTVPVRPGSWPPGTFEVAEDADMRDVVPALCLCLGLARDGSAPDGSSGRSVRLVEDMVGLHRNELAESVPTRSPSSGPS